MTPPSMCRWPVTELRQKIADAQSGERQLMEQLNQATSDIGSLTASLELARKRVGQNTELVKTGAGNRFDLEQSETNVQELTAKIAAARAQERRFARSSTVVSTATLPRWRR